MEREETVQPEAGSIEPIRTTYRWSLEPIPCEDCSEPTSRLWRNGDRLVCPSCKGW